MTEEKEAHIEQQLAQLMALAEAIEGTTPQERAFLAVGPDLVKILGDEVKGRSSARKLEIENNRERVDYEHQTIRNLALYDRLFKGVVVTGCLAGAVLIAIFGEHDGPFMGSIVALLSFTIGSVLSGSALSEFLTGVSRKEKRPDAE